MLLATFIKEDDGQDLAEYGLLVTLIALVVIAGVTSFGQNLLAFWNRLAGTPMF